MAIQLSPGVSVTEVDLTTVVPSVSSTTGAFAGRFDWGPANKLTVVDSEITLLNTFTPAGPTSNVANEFFTCASFLAYANDLRVVRVVNANTYNADANTSAGAQTLQLLNEDDYVAEYYYTDNGNQFGSFVAKYPGFAGNSLQVDLFDNANSASFSSNTFTSGGITRNWSSVVNGAPGTSTWATTRGGSNDEFHIVVTDANGLFTGTKGTVLEVFSYVSKALDAMDDSGQATYWKTVLLNSSNYVYGMDPPDYTFTNATWDAPAANTNFARINTGTGIVSIPLVGGTDQTPTDGNVQSGYDLFANKDSVDISLVLTGAHSTTVQQYVIDNVVTGAGSLIGRSGDALAFISPPKSAVVNNAGSETQDIKTWLTSLARSSSYVVSDSGWKYMYDKYNSVYRWVPLNGDIAGLCVYTDATRDPWWSPAGFNRGAVKNVVKLAWNPNQTARDILYPVGVNPVVTFPGNGTVLYGDKTLLSKPSAFDRINVRRLFIVLEKAISIAAKYSLFEFNDPFTRAQFVALVTPFLRDVQGRRGIYDFRVVCDETNNTGYVIDNNQFVGDIYIKPARSINFIKLNFIAVGTGVSFSEVTGAI
jgi:phage tail sheath protein FI